MALSKLKKVDADLTLAKALMANFSPNTTFQVANVTLTVTDITKKVNARAAARAKTAAAKTAYAATVAEEDKLEAQLAPIRRGVQRTLQGRYGDNSTKLAEFGFSPSKRTPPSAEVKAGAVKQAKATRAARGTLTKKQKKAIKGVVPSDGGVSANGGTASAPAVAAAKPAGASN